MIATRISCPGSEFENVNVVLADSVFEKLAPVAQSIAEAAMAASVPIKARAVMLPPNDDGVVPAVTMAKLLDAFVNEAI